MSYVWSNGKFSNISLFCLACWLLKPWHFEKFHCWPCYVHQVMSYVWSNGKFPIFLFLFGLIGYQSHGILGKFHHWPCYVHQVMSYVWSNAKFLILLLLFGTLAVKAMAFWGNFTVFPPKSAISQTCQNKFNNLIPPSYGLHFGKHNMGIIGVKYTIFMQKCHVNKIYKYGYCPGYMYIRYSMFGSVPKLSIFYVSTLIPIAFILYVLQNHILC